MIQLTEDLAMTADEHAYIVGRPHTRPGKGIELRDPTYYSSAALAVQGAIYRALRQGVANGSITTLRQFVQEHDRLTRDLCGATSPLK